MKRKCFAILLIVALVCSLLPTTAFAAEPFDYAYLEVGAVSGAPGEVVEIPIYLRGIQTNDQCRGFGFNISLDGLTYADGNNSVTWGDITAGIDYKLLNTAMNLVNAITFATTGPFIESNGLLATIRCVINEGATEASFSLTNVTISGSDSTAFLNSSDGTKQGVDPNAVVYPDGSVVTVKQPADLSMNVAATPETVTAGEEVTVTVSVNGGEYVGAAGTLTYDTDKFELKTAPASGWDESTGKFTYYDVNQGGSTYPEDNTIGTFVFTAKAQTEEVTGAFTLSETYVEETWEGGTSTEVATPCTNNGSAVVTIALKEDLNVTLPEGWEDGIKSVVYNGEAHGFDAVTSTTPGATIRYGTAEGTYNLETVPEASATDVDTYNLYYQVSALGYTSKTGVLTLNITPAEITYTAKDYSGAYDELAHGITVTVTNPTDATITYSENQEGPFGETPITLTQPGSKTVWFKINGGANYNEVIDSRVITISDAEIEVTIEGNVEVTYDGAPHISGTVTSGPVPADVEILYSLGTPVAEASETFDEIPSFTDADTYTVYWQATKDYYTSKTGSYTFTINPATIEYTADGYSGVYDGNEHGATVAVTVPAEGAVVKYGTQDGVYDLDASPVYTQPTDGPQIIYYQIMADNYSTVTGSVTVEITSAAIVYTAGNYENVYDGQSHGISLNVTTEDVTVTYSTDGEHYTEEVPAYKDVVEGATVYFKLEKENYDTVKDQRTVTITAKDAAITADSLSKTYGDLDPELTYQTSGLISGEELVVESITRAEGEDVVEGGYAITIVLGENPNYNVTNNPGVFTINPKDVTLKIDSVEKMFGDSDPEFTYSFEPELVGDDDLQVELSREEGEAVNTYVISATYDTANANYNVTVEPGTLTILAATQEVEIIPDYVSGYSLVLVYTESNATYTYNGQAMYDVTSAGYAPGESASYSGKVYALVVAGTASAENVAASLTPVADTLDCSDLDVNKSGSVDLRDAVAVVAVYNANETYMNDWMAIVLEADVNHDKQVNAADFSLIKAEYLK